jgi:hypothetical protein
MTTFIADYIFGKRDGRPRSRPSPAERLLAHLRAPARLQRDAAPGDARSTQTDTGTPLPRRTTDRRGSSEGLAG